MKVILNAPVALSKDAFYGIFSLLEELTDFRSYHGKEYKLPHILYFSVLAILSNAKSYTEIAPFISKGKGAEFDIYRMIIEHHPKYPEAISLQAECLLDILAQDFDAQASIDIYQIKMNQALENISDKRRQDLFLALLDKSNLALDIKFNLSDQITVDHPQYNQALVHKAHLIYGDARLSDVKRFEQAMLVLFNLPDDTEAKEFRKTFIEQYLICRGVQGEDLKQLKTYDPKNEENLKFFHWSVQKSLKEEPEQTSQRKVG